MILRKPFQTASLILLAAAFCLTAGAETKAEAEAAAKSTARQERNQAIEETKAAAKEGKGEAAMTDESTPADSLAIKGETAESHEDCGADFATMKAAEKEAPKKKASRNDLAVYSGFTLEFQGEKSPFSLMTTTVLPKEKLSFKVIDPKEGEELSATSSEGTVTRVNSHSWTWQAPEKTGHYCVKVSRPESADMACLQVFVLVPYNGEETLNGYPIGKYPDSTTQTDDPAKQRPRGFIEVTDNNLETWISPHFQLRQFLCKGFEGYPQYVIIRTRLLLKLEMLTEEFDKAGLSGKDIYVMSGFRTPAYNAKIGNKTTLSRHTFGDAADIYIDADRDGMIDDLNKDGQTDTEDARLLHTIVKNLKREGWRKPLGGGLSLYTATPSRSAFIHVDARGEDIFWDNL